MIDVTQVLLVIVITVLTVFLAVVGVQVYFILKDLRNTLTKLNRVLENAGELTEDIKRPVAGVSGILAGLKTGLSFAKFLGKKEKEKG